MHIEIIQANKNHFAQVYELICELEKETFPKKAFTNIFQNNCDNPNVAYFLACRQNVIIGLVSVYINLLLHHCAAIAEIQELIVKEKLQNSGIGKALIERSMQWSRQQGAAQLEVTCNINRMHAQQFYRHLGFNHSHQKFVYEL